MTRIGVATTFAVPSGAETARVFGTISPTIIEARREEQRDDARGVRRPRGPSPAASSSG